MVKRFLLIVAMALACTTLTLAQNTNSSTTRTRTVAPKPSPTFGAVQGSESKRSSFVGVPPQRILRCQPWCAGGHDPVPDTFSLPGAGLFTRWPARSQNPAAAESLPPSIRKHP